MNKRTYISAVPSRAIWLMLAVLVPAVLLPAGCVLWFMNEAMENEQLAVRQKLLDVYQGELEEIAGNLTVHWAEKG